MKSTSIPQLVLTLALAFGGVLAMCPAQVGRAAVAAPALERPSPLCEGLTHYWPLDKKDVRDEKYADLAGDAALLIEGGSRSEKGLFGEANVGEWLNGGKLPPCGGKALTVSRGSCTTAPAAGTTSSASATINVGDSRC